MIVRHGNDIKYISNDTVEDASFHCISDIHQLGEYGEAYLKPFLQSNSIQEKILNPFIFLVKNNAGSVAGIIGAQRLGALCILIPESRKNLLNHVMEHTGITLILKTTSDGDSIEKYEDLIMEKRTISQSFLKSKELESGGVGLLTSGSTGSSKIVLNSWKSMLLQGESTARQLLRGNPTRIVCHSSIGHAYAINGIFAIMSSPLQCNSQLCLATSIHHCGQLLEVRKDQYVVFYGTPGTYTQLINHEGPLYINVAYSAGSSLPEALRDEFKQKFGINIVQNYGSTETGGIAACRLHEDTPESMMQGFVGDLWDGVEVKIESPINTGYLGDMDGEILVKTPWQSIGFVENGELLNFPTYHRTGDSGKILNALKTDSSRKGLIVGHRIKAPMCARLGNFETLIQPDLLCKNLLKNPSILNVLLPTQCRGSLVVCVVLKNNDVNDEVSVTEKDLMKWCEDALEVHYRPTRIHIIPNIICTPAGKPIIYNAMDLE